MKNEQKWDDTNSETRFRPSIMFLGQIVVWVVQLRHLLRQPNYAPLQTIVNPRPQHPLIPRPIKPAVITLIRVVRVKVIIVSWQLPVVHLQIPAIHPIPTRPITLIEYQRRQPSPRLSTITIKTIHSPLPFRHIRKMHKPALVAISFKARWVRWLHHRLVRVLKRAMQSNPQFHRHRRCIVFFPTRYSNSSTSCSKPIIPIRILICWKRHSCYNTVNTRERKLLAINPHPKTLRPIPCEIRA